MNKINLTSIINLWINIILVSLAGFSVTIGWGLSPRPQPILSSILVWTIAITPILLSYITIKQFKNHNEIGRKLFILISLLVIPLELLMLVHTILDLKIVIDFLNILLVMHIFINIFFIFYFSKKSTKELFQNQKSHSEENV